MSAKVVVNIEVLEQKIFGFSPSPVRIVGLRFDPLDSTIEFEIEGEDIPANAKRVMALCHVKTNRAGEQFTTMEFQKL